MRNILANRLNHKQAVIGIVGLGYVGLPLMLRYCEVGYKVIGFDIDRSKVAALTEGKSYIEHISAAAISQAVAMGLEATTDFSRSIEADALILCVPTPLNKYREPDLSFVLDTTDTLVPFMRPGQVISLESTTYPGTTDEELLPRNAWPETGRGEAVSNWCSSQGVKEGRISGRRPHSVQIRNDAAHF